MAAPHRRSGLIRLLLFITCLASLPCQVWSQTNLPAPVFLQELRAQALPDEADTQPGQPSLHFGHSIAVFGDTALVGMPLFENVGRVAVFRRDASGFWLRQGSIESPDGVSGCNFGLSVTIHRHFAFVGFGGEVPETHIFRRTNDRFELVRSTSLSFIVDQRTGLLFSGSRAADGSVVMTVFRLDKRGRLHRVDSFVISAEMTGSAAVWGDTFVTVKPSDNGTQGAAYVFERRQGVWQFTQQLIAADGNADDSFGASLAIHGDTIVIGAPRADETVDPVCEFGRSGAVYAFERRRHLWSEQQKIRSSLERCFTNFGRRIAFNGELLLVMNAESNTFADDAAWHVFERQFGQYQPIAFRFVSTFNRPVEGGIALQGETFFYGVESADQDDRGSVTLWDLRPDQ
jgi:hypothetical protein